MYSIQEVARLAHTTSRTLRHYDEVGLVRATRAANGYRSYDEEALVRLQRVLLLRDLGLGIPAISAVLEAGADDAVALESHLGWLRAEQERLDRQIASVERTIRARREEEEIVVEEMFDGFDHTQYRGEVEERWGAGAYAAGDAWWRSMTAPQREEWQERQRTLQSAWRDAAARRVDPAGEEAQALARRQDELLSGMPGTPQTPEGRPTAEYLLGLGDMYVADPRFARHYGGATGAELVRDALRAYVPSRSGTAR